jgi:diketogulonate reductase-like aldo/keto reductase
MCDDDESAFRMTRNQFLRFFIAAMPAWLAAGIVRGGPPASDRMQTRPIPSTGAPLPVVGCGTWRTFDVGPTPAERAPLEEVLEILFAAGGSVIDTAPMYAPAETVVGDLLAAMKARELAFIATKVWIQGREAGVEQMRRSMQLLRVERLDLMQVHNLVDWRTQLATLRAWKRDGRIRYLGITHYTSSAYPELEAVMRAEPVDFVQLNYALNDRAAEERLLPLAMDRGVAVIVNQPFGGGRLIQSLKDRPVPSWASEIQCETWAQILLKYVLGHPAVTCVIPGTGRPEHMRDNVRAGYGTYPDAALRKRMVESIA